MTSPICSTCLRRIASDADEAAWRAHGEGDSIPNGWPDAEGSHLCWAKIGGACEPPAWWATVTPATVVEYRRLIGAVERILRDEPADLSGLAPAAATLIPLAQSLMDKNARLRCEHDEARLDADAFKVYRAAVTTALGIEPGSCADDVRQMIEAMRGQQRFPANTLAERLVHLARTDPEHADVLMAAANQLQDLPRFGDR